MRYTLYFYICYISLDSETPCYLSLVTEVLSRSRLILFYL